MSSKKRGRPPVDLGEKIRLVLSHTSVLSAGAESPIAHYLESVNASFSLISYVGRRVAESNSYESVRSRHMGLLHRFVLANLIETFERFVKELAAICVDQLAPFVNDDRYDSFSTKGNELIAHFDAGSIGKALCESDTWLSNKTINERFRKLLGSWDGEPWKEFLFPARRQPPRDQVERASILAILWQLRHTLAHNSGVLTGSDAMKLRSLSGRWVDKERLLSPGEEDLRYVKRFLTESAEESNRRIVHRLSELLTELHEKDPSLFDAKDRAALLARTFRRSVEIHGERGEYHVK